MWEDEDDTCSSEIAIEQWDKQDTNVIKCSLNALNVGKIYIIDDFL